MKGKVFFGLICLLLATAVGGAEASGWGFLVSTGEQTSVYQATLVLTQEIENEPFWRNGSDLAVNRVKVADGVTLLGQLHLTGLEPDRLKGVWRIGQTEGNLEWCPQKGHWFQILPSDLPRAGEARALELDLRIKNARGSWVRVVFKFTALKDARQNFSLFLDGVTNPVPESERSARTMAEAYRRLQTIDPTFGGGVTDTALLLEPERVKAEEMGVTPGQPEQAEAETPKPVLVDLSVQFTDRQGKPSPAVVKTTDAKGRTTEVLLPDGKAHYRVPAGWWVVLNARHPKERCCWGTYRFQAMVPETQKSQQACRPVYVGGPVGQYQHGTGPTVTRHESLIGGLWLTPNIASPQPCPPGTAPAPPPAF